MFAVVAFHQTFSTFAPLLLASIVQLITVHCSVHCPFTVFRHCFSSLFFVTAFRHCSVQWPVLMVLHGSLECLLVCRSLEMSQLSSVPFRDILIRIRILRQVGILGSGWITYSDAWVLILLFSSVAFKMTTKKGCFLIFVAYYIHLYPSLKITSH